MVFRIWFLGLGISTLGPGFSHKGFRVAFGHRHPLVLLIKRRSACVCASKSRNPGPERFRDLDGQDLIFYFIFSLSPSVRPWVDVPWSVFWGEIGLCFFCGRTGPARTDGQIDVFSFFCFFWTFLSDFSPLLLN